jgi:hypothetical protein
MKLFRNTTAVLVLTLFTGLAVFTAIQLGGRLFGTPTASARTITSQAAQGQSGGTSAGGSGQSSSGATQSDPYGSGSSSGGSASSSGGQTYTCPATGCTASSCHATQ